MTRGRSRTNMKRFWKRVDTTGDCWNWQGFKNADGYGLLRFNGGKHLAHRLAFLFAFGTVPDGACVLHHCDNPSCCKPGHLWLGNQEDNARDAIQKGRFSHASRNVGERNGLAKLTKEDIKMIRARYSQGELQHKLGEEYGVSQSAISLVVNGRRWFL